MGWTGGTFVVTGWSPTEGAKPAVGTAGVVEDGQSCGPRMAVVGIMEDMEVDDVREDVGETDGWADEISMDVRREEGGEDTNGTAWPGAEEVSAVWGMLEMMAVGREEGREARGRVWG